MVVVQLIFKVDLFVCKISIVRGLLTTRCMPETELTGPPLHSSESTSFQSSETEKLIPDINRRVLLTLIKHLNTSEELNQKSRHRGWTALHFAVDARNFVAYAALKEAGADIHLPDDDQITPDEMLRSIYLEHPS